MSDERPPGSRPPARPLDQRPPARPIPPRTPSATPAPAGPASRRSPEPNKKPPRRRDKWIKFGFIAAIALVVIGIIVSSLAGSIERGFANLAVQQPSAECDSAFRVASADLNTLYRTHPFYGPEYDALYSDGTITAEEQARLDEMMADEQAQFEALVQPILGACSGIEDLYAGAFKYRDEADWALQETEYVSRADAKKYFVTSWCTTYPDSNACSDYEEDDWR